MEQRQNTPETTESSRSPNYTAEELYLVVRAQQGQIRELVDFTEELNTRLKKWEMFFGDKFAGVFAGEVGTKTDEQLGAIELPESMAKGFGALLAGEVIAGNAPPSEAEPPSQDTRPRRMFSACLDAPEVCAICQHDIMEHKSKGDCPC